MTRHHRLWEVFLNRHLGIGWEDVNNYACNLEHATTELVANRLEEFLDNPEVCPHGSPIPSKELKRPSHAGILMADLEVGQSARVLSIIIERNPEFLRYLSNIGLIPDTTIKVIDKATYDGTLTIEVNNTTKAIGREAASLIMTEPLSQ